MRNTGLSSCLEKKSTKRIKSYAALSKIYARSQPEADIQIRALQLPRCAIKLPDLSARLGSGTAILATLPGEVPQSSV